MKRALITLLLVCAPPLLGAARAQNDSSPPPSGLQVLGARFAFCGGLRGAAFDATVLCGVSAYAEWPEFGIFAQTLPRFGPFWENWEVYGYAPRDVATLGQLVQVRAWPGVAVGMEGGAFFVRAQADILFVVDLRSKPP